MVPSMSKWIQPALCLLSVTVHAANEGFAEPDTVLLKDGSTQKGVIVRNTSKEVWLQNRYSIQQFPKSEIVRIRDQADIGLEFTKANTPGDLPAWRVMVNDLRNNDSVKSLEQIPATHIDNGYLKNIPYLSFRINELAEMNIYGDPDDPAAVEFGVYGRMSSNDKMRRVLRSFLAGFLSNRKEVGAIYGIPFSGGQECVGQICFKITPASAPDAYGGWWICLFNPKKLDAARLDDSAYAKLTRPFGSIVDKAGRVKRDSWSIEDLNLARRIGEGTKNASALVRGFFRDESGQFRVLTVDQNN
ncbi:MAG: hypothetical protein ACO3GO_01960 [Terrimicrobiaceae bacterium]